MAPTTGVTSGTQGDIPSPPTHTGIPTVNEPLPTLPAMSNGQPSISLGLTHHRPDGNRLVAGQGNLPEVSPVDIPLAGIPVWVTAAPTGDGATLWVMALKDGQVQAFRISADGRPEETTIIPNQLPPGQPPVLKIKAGNAGLPVAFTDAASLLAPAAVLPLTDRLVSIQAGGDLLVWNQALSDFTAVPVVALPDARILVDEAERLLLLTDPTPRYGHGVLGDGLEAAGITLIETHPTLRIVLTIPIADPTVIEGILPIWTDLTGDGVREIIVTLSNSEQGSQIVVFNESGAQIAAGPAIGQGNRWRHQLVVAPFGLSGELELVDVLTPHIGGTVEFYRLEAGNLRIVAKLPGYSSHMIGSRNLDMAVAGDFDGDARIELLIPNQQRTVLGAIRRAAAGAEVVWTLPLGGAIVSNIAAVTLADGRIMVGVGRGDAVLRLWGP